MNKKFIKIVCAVLIFIAIAFVAFFKFDTVNRTKESMSETTQRLLDSINTESFDKIKRYIKNTDATDLSEEEIYNFLLNTNLYRLMFNNDDVLLSTYSAKVNFFNTDKGLIEFSFVALDGDIITNSLQYVNTGVNEYFVTSDTTNSDKVINRYPFAKDLYNGDEFTYDKDDAENKYLFTYRLCKDEYDNFYLEVFEDSEDDLKIAIFNSLDETLQDKENEYRYEWNDDCSEFSVYYSGDELSFKDDGRIKATSIFSATIVQALNGNPDWKLTINYYDYSTEELIKTSVIR